MTNNFTPRTQQILADSRKEAEKLNHNYIGTEHILLAMARSNDPVLIMAQLDCKQIINDLLKQVGTGLTTKVAGNILYTPRVKKVIALAGKAAKELGCSYVGVQHLLMGLFREGEGIAARVLKDHGILIDFVCELKPVDTAMVQVKQIIGKTIKSVEVIRRTESNTHCDANGEGITNLSKEILKLTFTDDTYYEYTRS